jgi:BCD family chlorophyll transporter-like MFS transporter
MAAVMGPPWPLKPSVFALGFANGVFAVAAIGSMFMFAAGQSRAKEGVRMGLFGASQAISFGIGGFAGTVAVDIVKAMTGSPVMAYGGVFAIEAALFAFAALLAASIGREQGANDLRNPLVLAAQHQMSGN